MKRFWIIFVGVLMVICFVVGMQIRGPVIQNLTSQMEQLKNDWVRSQAEVISQNEMNSRLTAENGNLGKAYRKEANARAMLEAQLNEIKGKGPEVVYVDKPGMRFYEDGLVNISYSTIDKEFDYRIKARALHLTIINQGKGWTAQIYDPMQDKFLKVSKMDVVQTEPKIKWYKKLKLGAGVAFVDGPQVSGVVGYDKTFIQPIIGLNDGQIKYGAGIIRLFW